MTTSSIVEQLGAARRGGDPTARRTPSSPTVEAPRTQSHSALTHVVAVLGYPSEWADELERRAVSAGRVWSFTPCRDEAGDADGSR